MAIFKIATLNMPYSANIFATNWLYMTLLNIKIGYIVHLWQNWNLKHLD